MIFDVMVREGYNAANKQRINVHRVHDSRLGEFIRKVQDAQHYVYSVIPLFRNRFQKNYNDMPPDVTPDLCNKIGEEGNFPVVDKNTI